MESAPSPKPWKVSIITAGSVLAVSLKVMALAAASMLILVGAVESSVAKEREKKAAAPVAAVEGLAPIKPVKSFLDLRRTGVVMQVYDYSCGAASLATLLDGYFGEKYTELDILKIAGKRYDAVGWKARVKEGLTMDDLAFVAQQLGFEAEGAKIGMDGLIQVNGPLIVHENKGPGLEHFTVFRGIKNGAIFVADPAIGNAWYSPGDFVSQFTGFALAVWRKGTKLPASYALAFTKKDDRDELRAARYIFQRRIESLPSAY